MRFSGLRSFHPAAIILVSIILVSAAPFIRAQEDEAAFDEDPDDIDVERTIPEDVRSADFGELTRWLERLELSTRGGRSELEERLLEYYDLADDERPDDDTEGAEGAEEAEEDDDTEGAERGEIVIESAQESRYFALDEVDQRYVRLRGGVALRLEDIEEGVAHVISADELVYNRDTEALTARGNIEYVIDRGTSSERFTGEHLTVYLDDWEGVFLEGTSTRERRIEGRELEFRYTGSYITRSPDDLVTLEDATITSSVGDPPYYRIRAKKIWVLGPGEWGMQDGALYVGRVPTLYLPFFFRPGDRLFFNPVVGARNREGAFLQTTTYLLGRKDPEESPVSVLQLAEGAGEEVPRERQGLFLRPVEEPEEARESDDTLKLLADVYTTLGAYLGLEADLTDVPAADRLEASLGLGAAKHIYSRDGFLYTDRYIDEQGQTSMSWNTTRLGDVRLPFRYNLSFLSRLNRAGARVETDLEWYSDPYVMRDFGNRAESMDWFTLIDPEEQTTTDTGTDQTELTWRGILGYSPDMDATRPYLSRLDLDRLEVSARWLSREIPDEELSPEVLAADRSPETRFYFPESLVLPSVDATASGTLAEGELGTSRAGERSSTDEAPVEDQETAAEGTEDGTPGDDAELPSLRPPVWEDDAPQPDREDEGDGGADDELRPPSIRGELGGLITRTPMSYDLDYSLRPTLRVDHEYRDRPWITPEDMDFSYEYSTLTTNNTLTTSYMLGFYDRLFEVDGRVRANGRYRTLYNEWDPEDPGIERVRESSFDYSRLTVRNDLTTRAYPVQDDPYFGDSNLSYTLDATYFERSYTGADGSEEPRYRNELIHWTPEYVSTHNVAGNLNVDYWDATQALRIVGNLPPTDNRYDGTLNLTTGPLGSRVRSAAAREDEEWVFDPLRITETLAFRDDLRLSQGLTYDIESDRITSADTEARVLWLTGSYRGRYTTGYTFDADQRRFEERSREAFRPVEAAVGLHIDHDTDPFWRRRVELGVELATDLRMDLQRFTASSLDVQFGLETAVHEFLDLSVSVTSSNALVYRYVPELAEQVGVEPKNPGTDLLRSFNFADADDRRESDFNLRRVNVEAQHYLGDWVLSLEYSGLPERVEDADGRGRYEWRREFAVFLEWMPIPELNADVEVNDEGTTYGRQ
ncbi:MAG: hypothetical protein ACOCWU_00830 [Spirochaetota bacterium]